MGENVIVKSFVEQINENQRFIASEFQKVSNDMHYVHELAKKNKKKIRGLKWSVFGLGLAVIVLASELAERKRCENWLKDEIDELKKTVDNQGKLLESHDGYILEKIEEEAYEDEETYGGAADA